MADCAGLSCGRRKGLIEDAKLWSNSLKAVLSSKEGRSEFLDFLQSCDLFDESRAVEFWEQCNDIVGECHQLMKTKSAAGSYDSNASSALLTNASTVVEEYVNSCQINLERELIRKLNDSVSSKDPDKIYAAFMDAKGAAHDLLKEIHSCFAEELDTKYGLTNK